ncbi:MAG TPA: cytochrome c peroxidase [Myxococcota bacterium]|nr:cytochrome c peroxidase [Myxococcota bacterium]
MIRSGELHAAPRAARPIECALRVLIAALWVGCGGEERSAPLAQSPPAGPEASAARAQQPDAAREASEPAREASEIADDAALRAPDRAALRARAAAVFGVLPAEATNPDNAVTPEKLALGRMLYYDVRLSKNHDLSCNSCHLLDRAGVDGEPTSSGHRGQRGARNSPSVYNAALHFVQFWDGRAANVEEQAKAPILNPVEMAMPSEQAVVETLRSIPGYAPLFRAAFPEDGDPITYDNLARAIGAFERRLLTPAPFDAFIAGDDGALNDEQLAGLDAFFSAGCIACHQGAAIGGGMYQKLGVIKPYPTDDPGRAAISGDEADRQLFKVPSLRNVARTAPYLHDGSVPDLEAMIRIMAEYQLGIPIDDTQVRRIAAFLDSLSGSVDAALIAQPELPPSGPDTPAPDPS